MYLISKVLYLNNANLWEKIYNWYQGSVIKELLDYFSGTVFGVEFSTYENFTVGGGVGGTLRNVIIGLMFGSIFAAVLMYETRAVQGRFVRGLLRRESFSQETAVTLMEAGAFRDPSVRRDLARGGALSKLVRCVEEETRDPEDAKPFKMDFLTAHFYIPEDLKYRAEVRYEQKGYRIPQFLLTVLLVVVIAVLLCRVLPSFVSLADWLMTALS